MNFIPPQVKLILEILGLIGATVVIYIVAYFVFAEIENWCVENKFDVCFDLYNEFTPAFPEAGFWLLVAWKKGWLNDS